MWKRLGDDQRTEILTHLLLAFICHSLINCAHTARTAGWAEGRQVTVISGGGDGAAEASSSFLAQLKKKNWAN